MRHSQGLCSDVQFVDREVRASKPHRYVHSIGREVELYDTEVSAWKLHKYVRV